jgi:type II secretory pathway component PulM
MPIAIYYCALAFYYVAQGILYLALSYVMLAPLFEGDGNTAKPQPTPQAQHAQIPQVSEDVEVLLALVQQYMHQQYDASVLRKQVLNLPALPSEGY